MLYSRDLVRISVKLHVFDRMNSVDRRVSHISSGDLPMVSLSSLHSSRYRC